MQETVQSTPETPNTDSQETSSSAPEAKKERKFPVMEIFGPTIQGEGFVAGTQTAFIRFGLCDYKCKLCDSPHAVDPQFVHANAMWMTQQEMLDEVNGRHRPGDQWVTLSGGNPAIHDLTKLVHGLRGQQTRIAVETQGTKAPDWLHAVDVITCSPKSPGMGEKFEPDKFEDFLLKFRGHPGLNVKVVVFSQVDLEFAAMINVNYVRPYFLHDRFFLSLGNPDIPFIKDDVLNTGTNGDEHRLKLLRDYAMMSEEITQHPSLGNARFFPQLHVLAWSNEAGR